MFVIELTDKNLPEIYKYIPEAERSTCGVEFYADHPMRGRPMYFITNFVDTSGKVWTWTVLPEYVLKGRFEFDPLVAANNWDQIVRITK